MIPTLALRAVVTAAIATVQTLTVVSVGDRTEVVIGTEGSVTVEHFMLTDPPRIVLDLQGATYGLAEQNFLDINRGGVLGIRTSQYRPDVVRVVVDLATGVDYEVTRGGGEVRISFPNPAGGFERWSAALEEGGAPAPAEAAGPLLGDPLAQLPVAQPPPVRPAADQAAVPVQTTRPRISTEPRISVYFRNTPILDVLATFSEFSGRSIVPGRNVAQQTVNADIRDQPWDVALDAILQGLGLTARELDSGIIRVGDVTQLREIEAQEAVVTRPFRINYVSVDSLIPVVQGMTSDTGKVVANRSTNTLVVTDRESVVERIGPMLSMLDVRTPQVTIRAKIVSVNRTALEGLGIRFELKDVTQTPDGPSIHGFGTAEGAIGPNAIEGGVTDERVVSLTGDAVAVLGNATSSLPATTLRILSTLVLNGHSLLSLVEAVEQLSFTDIQAQPVVRVLDNRQARIQVGNRTPIRVVDAQAGTEAAQATVTFQETGVILEVTPHVTGEQVLLDLHAELSEIQAEQADIGGTFFTRETDTQVLLDDGETAVISGLTRIRRLGARSGIPILMNLPLIGRLFRVEFEEQSKEDLLIMITPHIVRDAGF